MVDRRVIPLMVEMTYITSHPSDRARLEVRLHDVGISLWTSSLDDDRVSRTSVHRTTWVLLDKGSNGCFFQCDVTGRTRTVHPEAVSGVKRKLADCSGSLSYDASGLISYVLSITEMADKSDAAPWFREELPNLFEYMLAVVTKDRVRHVDEVLSS